MFILRCGCRRPSRKSRAAQRLPVFRYEPRPAHIYPCKLQPRTSDAVVGGSSCPGSAHAALSSMESGWPVIRSRGRVRPARVRQPAPELLQMHSTESVRADLTSPRPHPAGASAAFLCHDYIADSLHDKLGGRQDRRRCRPQPGEAGSVKTCGEDWRVCHLISTIGSIWPQAAHQRPADARSPATLPGYGATRPAAISDVLRPALRRHLPSTVA